jgi:hypothetical protein
MAAKIEELSEYHKSMLKPHCDMWIKHGLNTDPADRPNAELGIKQAYESAGVKPPSQIEWFDDPFQASDWLKAEMKKLGGTDAQISSTIGRPFYGQNDVSWLGYYDYFDTYFPEVEGPARLRGLNLLARSAGWVWLLKDIAVCVERPKNIKLFYANDSQEGVLHSVDSPAFEWRSGRGLYFVRGVPVDEELFTNPLSVEIINKVTNAEVKRVLIEKYGASKYLLESGAKVISQDEFGTLLRVDIPDDEPLVMVRYVNSTPEAGMTECPYCHEDSNKLIDFKAVMKRTGNFCKCGSFVKTLNNGNVYKIYMFRVDPSCATPKDAFRYQFKFDSLNIGDFVVVDES